MDKNFLRILQLGEHDFWKLQHDVRAAAEGEYEAWKKTLANTNIFLWKGPKDGPESAVFLQMLESLGLHMTVYNCASLDTQGLEEKASKTKEGSLHITCGFNDPALDILTAHGKGVWFTGYSPINSPWAALADVAFFQNLSSSLDGSPDISLDSFRVCVIGAVGGLGQSLIEAAIYAPFELFMAVPPWGDPDHHQTGIALKSGAKVFMTREPNLALDGAHLIYIDTRVVQMAVDSDCSCATIPMGMESFSWKSGFNLSPEYKAYAKADAPVLSLLECGENVLLPDMDLKLCKERDKLRKYTLMASLAHMVQG